MTVRVTSNYGNQGERLLQRFKRMCLRSGLFKELKLRRFYETPSQKRRRRAKAAVRAVFKAERKKLKGNLRDSGW